MSRPAAVPRLRAVSWEDPLAAARDGLALSGLDNLRAIRDGELPPPPIAATLGLELVEVQEGRVVFGLPAHEWLFNPIGSVHGGALATLIDSAASCAVHATLPAGVAYATSDLHVTYVRPLRSGRATCTGEVLHAGRRLATATARVTDDAGRLLAHGTATCAVLGAVE
ncbi:MAG TPA: PaaI family thioesterase [Solirubrobacteraceae bacterium]|nr:PaaI family thioesterase [Solirubrobacteraceae bacterium]